MTQQAVGVSAGRTKYFDHSILTFSTPHFWHPEPWTTASLHAYHFLRILHVILNFTFLFEIGSMRCKT